jgi:dTDP-4-amino-4,6-dideoxygalactose transaminase
MEILVHSKVILDVTKDGSMASRLEHFWARLEKYPDLKVWVATDAISTLAESAINTEQATDARDMVAQFCQDVAVLPVRQEDILAGLKRQEQPLDIAILVEMAQRYRIPIVVVPDVNQEMALDGVQVYSAAEFWRMLPAISRDSNASRPVPFLDLHAQLHQIYNGIDARFADIIANTAYILGPQVEAFEKGFAKLQEAKHCLGVSNGTAALHIALEVLGVGRGDRVIVPVNTFIATAEAVTLTGAEPVFIDCDDYNNIDVHQCREYLTALKAKGAKLPKVIIPVHLYGQPADMDALAALAAEFELDIVEDACQAHLATWSGHRAGFWGKFAAFSFYPGKNLGAFGEGGALITNDENLFETARLYRQHGERKRYFHNIAGHNYRMEALQGAVLSEKLAHIDRWTEQRRAHARAYHRGLADIDAIQLPKVRSEAESVFHLYVIHCQQRDALKQHLEQSGIFCGLHYPTPLHMQPAYRDLEHPYPFPKAESLAAQLLSLPMYPELTEDKIQYVCESVRNFVTR